MISTVPKKIAQIDYCPQGGSLYGRKDGTTGCFYPVEPVFSLSLTRVPPSHPEKKDGKVLFAVKVEGADGSPIASEGVLLKLSQPGKLNIAGYSPPINLVSTDENGEALVEYTQRGEHLLADIDLVINGLRVQGITSVAPNNINLPARTSDLSGHTLMGTYLDAARAAREKINGMVYAVLGKL